MGRSIADFAPHDVYDERSRRARAGVDTVGYATNRVALDGAASLDSRRHRGDPAPCAAAKRPMRILHVINSLRPSGAERHLANLFGPLAAMGVENHLVTFVPGNGFEDQVRHHVTRAELGVGRANLAAVVRMAREVDVVHTQLVFSDVVGRAAAALAGTPSVSTLQTSAWASETRRFVRMDPLRYHATRLADAATARLALRHFAVSSKAMRAYVEGLHVPAERIEVIANTVDLAEFDPSKGPTRAEARAGFGIAAGEFAVVTLARLIPC